MEHRSWITVFLLAVIAVLLGLLVLGPQAPLARAAVSEGQAANIVAIASSYGNDSLLYLVDTSREVVLVYGFHQPGIGAGRDPRSGAFEFLAGRLYRWDAMLATKHEYAIRGIRTLQGLRVFGPGSSEEEFKKAGN